MIQRSPIVNKNITIIISFSFRGFVNRPKNQKINHLRFFYEDVLDEGLTLRFAIVHPHIVDLVAPDLTVPQFGFRCSPFHPNS